MSSISHRQRSLTTRAAAPLSLVATLMLTAPLTADNLHRRYDFEEGTPGTSAAEVLDTIDTPPHLQVAFGDYYTFDWSREGSNHPLPDGEPIQTWITNNVDPTPSLLEPFAGSGPSFIDVSDGSALDSPSTGSSVALDFDGAGEALQGTGFRDSYALITDYDSDAPYAGQYSNVTTTFFAFSQAWVYPDSAGQGANQTVWAIGEENGGVRVTSDGFWELAAVGGVTGSTASVPVAFDEWTHVGVARSGGSARLYINGSLVAAGSGSFGKFGDFVTLGADEDFVELFDGKIDSFAVGGNYLGGFSPFRDFEFFADLGLPEPTGVLGDVDQDGDADQDDYQIWSGNVGFDNGFGVGDVTTLVLGDLDGNGRVDFFDFNEISSAVQAAGMSLTLNPSSAPEPSALLIAAWAAAGALVRRRR